MGCFLACFGGPRDRKRRRSSKRSPPRSQRQVGFEALRPNASPRQESLEKTTAHFPPERLSLEAAVGSLPVPLSELRETDEKGSYPVSKKKVTFDLNIKTYEHVPTYVDEEDETKTDDTKEEKEGSNAAPNSEAYPLNHRYQNCSDSDDEESEYGEDEDEDDYGDCISDEEDNPIAIGRNEEESYESFFSLSIDKELESNHEVNSAAPKNASSPERQSRFPAKANPRDRSQYVNSVLNPVENLSQWKEVKVHAVPSKDPNKENFNLEQVSKLIVVSEPSFKVKKPEGPCVSKPEVSVDASLSTWLASSDDLTMQRTQESNSVCSNSSLSREERPILGALTVEDIKQASVTSSPRRSPSKSPDEIPILGTVGCYWNCTRKSERYGERA